MAKNYGQNEPAIVDYVEATFQPKDKILRRVHEHIAAKGLPMNMQVSDMDARHLEVLTRAIGAKNAVEIGTLGGYSAINIARGLAPGGKLYTFEYEPEYAEVARESFALAGFAESIEIFVGAACDNLGQIERHGPFDLVFVDADKTSYPHYLAWAAENLRIGGIILGDNAFAWGHIHKEKYESPEIRDVVKALREFNTGIAGADRFRATMLPTGEGLAMAVKVR